MGGEGVAMRSLNITPEQFAQLLRDNNVTREQFIALYGLRPLVYIPELPRRAKAAFVLVCALIFALALFGNCLVLYVVTRSRAMRTVTNIFICSLALSDLLIAFFCVPFTMLQNISSNWLGGACRRGTGRDGLPSGSPRQKCFPWGSPRLPGAARPRGCRCVGKGLCTGRGGLREALPRWLFCSKLGARALQPLVGRRLCLWRNGGARKCTGFISKR